MRVFKFDKLVLNHGLIKKQAGQAIAIFDHHPINHALYLTHSIFFMCFGISPTDTLLVSGSVATCFQNQNQNIQNTFERVTQPFLCNHVRTFSKIPRKYALILIVDTIEHSDAKNMSASNDNNQPDYEWPMPLPKKAHQVYSEANA